MAFDLQIADETAERLVVDVLRHTLECVRVDIKRLSALDVLADYQQEDLSNDFAIETHLKEVIKYFSPPSDHEHI